MVATERFDMIRKESRWSDVSAGDYVKDRTGKMWRVVRWDHIVATLEDADGRRVKTRPDPYAEVEHFIRSMKDAVELVQRVLGGEVITTERNQT